MIYLAMAAVYGAVFYCGYLWGARSAFREMDKALKDLEDEEL